MQSFTPYRYSTIKLENQLGTTYVQVYIFNEKKIVNKIYSVTFTIPSIKNKVQLVICIQNLMGNHIKLFYKSTV